MLADIFSRYKTGSSLFFTVAFCLTCLIWKSNIISRTLSGSSQVLDFFSATFSSFGRGMARLVDSYGTYEAVRQERDALREKLKAHLDLQIELVRLREENAKLRQALQLPPLTSYPVVMAEVISQDPDNWFRTIIINKGSSDGITAYMPVVALQLQESSGQTNLAVGVVGKIIQVNPHSARILPLTDQFSRIGVHLKKTGHWALLIGQSPQQEKPWIDYLSLGVFLSPGDELLTSGGDGIFPRGLPVGRVGKRIERLGSFQRAEVEPAIDFHKLDFVVVIQKKVETETLQFLPLRPENIEEPKLPAAQPGVEKMPPQSVDNKTKETTDTP